MGWSFRELDSSKRLLGRLEWSQLSSHCIAITAVCIAAVLSRITRLFSDLPTDNGLFLCAIGISGWHGGKWPAAVATLVAVLVSGGFFAGPLPFMVGARPEQNLTWLLLVAEGSLFVWISSRLFAARSSAIPSASAGKRESRDAKEINYKQIVEGVKGCAILFVDSHGCVANWTDAAENITGFPADEIIGMPLSLLDEDVANSGVAFHKAMDIAKKGGVGALQTRCVRKDCSEFWADVVIGTVRDDEDRLLGFSVVLRDITAKKQAEELLEQRSRQLLEASRLKDEFLATVSHELRTPLNSILGWTQLFRAGRLDDGGRSHALETIEQSAKTQARLIEDLLDVSRIVTGKMRLDVRSVQMTEVIEAAVETIRPAAEAKNIAIQLMLERVGCPVFGDPNRLQQVVWNLLSNAIKFTQSGGAVQVGMHRDGPTMRLQIKDNGIGIKADFLPHVFDAFRQADSSSTRSHKGLGLGLTIVRRVIELHGGTVRADSLGEGAGATFEIQLPVALTPKSSPVISTVEPDHRPLRDMAGPIYPSTALYYLRVLVVDDDAETRDLIATVLSQSGIHVDSVASAAEGISAIEHLSPDVVVSDIEMPEADGYMFIQEVRALDAKRGGRTPAVALTAYTRAEDRSRSLAAGFQLHLAKPVDADELVNAVMTLASQRRKGPDHAQVAHS